MTSALKHTGLFILATAISFSCRKQFDLPPVKPIESLNKINVANIKAKWPANGSYTFKSDSGLYCVITADESSGNLYKEIYVRDVTGALHVRLVNSGGLFTGDSIRINLQGVILNASNNLIQLDSVDAEKSIVKLASGFNPPPVNLSLQQVLANTSPTNAIQSRLVTIDHVEFAAADQEQPFADATGKASLTRVIRSCSGQTLSIRTSGYCSFAGRLTPKGNGSITGIVSQYGNSIQLILRNYNELNMSNALCAATSNTAAYLNKNFNDNSISSGGWSSVAVTNTVAWSIGSSNDTPTPYAKVQGYVNGANVACETWYVSPAVNLSAASRPALSFQCAGKYAGPALDILVSTNYTSGAPSAATWTSLAAGAVLPVTSGSSYVWTASGNISLSAYKTNNMRVAFKYKSTASGATTYELDDILIREN